MMPDRIERLIPGEEIRLRAIRLRALAEAPDAFGTTFKEASALPLEDWQRQLAERTTFIAMAGECDIGIVRAAPHDDDQDAACLLSLWVAPKCRLRGIAAGLVDSVVAWATTEKYRRLVLDVTETNTAAINLYLKKGFVPNGTIGALPPPRDHIREWQMERQLIADTR